MNSPVPELTDVAEILRNFQREHIDKNSKLTVVARRRRILHSAITALGKTYFDWHKLPEVEFVGEMAADHGGPSREFFRLLMKEVQSTMGIFEGKPGRLFFVYDQADLDQGKFYTAGKLIAWSVLHGGPGIKALDPALFQLLCGQVVDLQHFEYQNLPEREVQDKLQKVLKH
ncbi:hypothetical protein SKAU_G00099130 [Synaphobranchus kaupii]|uniref:HECT domain-containing protein n=1 Tax=Synaphobranchus kaupii TaxID=118154 RepID=A0A9Q1J533_SYNKA|nr:hypothetical protein SKAU_G00099130 [Synaphobranchus kaupii]